MKVLDLFMVLFVVGAFLLAVSCSSVDKSDAVSDDGTADDDTSDDDIVDDDDATYDDDDDEPYIVDTSNTDCKPYKVEEPKEGIDFSYEDGILTVVHVNAYYNCCVDRIDVEMQIEDFVIDLYETEVVSTPCDCLCYLDVITRIANLRAGTYTVNIYAYGALSVSGEVTIP